MHARRKSNDRKNEAPPTVGVMRAANPSPHSSTPLPRSSESRGGGRGAVSVKFCMARGLIVSHCSRQGSRVGGRLLFTGFRKELQQLTCTLACKPDKYIA